MISTVVRKLDGKYACFERVLFGPGDEIEHLSPFRLQLQGYVVVMGSLAVATFLAFTLLPETLLLRTAASCNSFVIKRYVLQMLCHHHLRFTLQSPRLSVASPASWFVAPSSGRAISALAAYASRKISSTVARGNLMRGINVASFSFSHHHFVYLCHIFLCAFVQTA